MKGLLIGSLVAIAAFAAGEWVTAKHYAALLERFAPQLEAEEPDDDAPAPGIPGYYSVDFHHCELGDVAPPGARFMQWRWFLDNRSPQCAKLEHKHGERRVTPKPEVETWDA